MTSDPGDRSDAALRRAQQLAEEAERSRDLAAQAQQVTGRSAGALARMHDQMAATHERIADLQETAANRPGADRQERTDLLASAAEHREHADADRRVADTGRREVAENSGAPDGHRADR